MSDVNIVFRVNELKVEYENAISCINCNIAMISVYIWLEYISQWGRYTIIISWNLFTKIKIYKL